MSQSQENKTMFWMLFLIFGLLMLIVGYLIGNIYPFKANLPINKEVFQKTTKEKDITQTSNKVENKLSENNLKPPAIKNNINSNNNKLSESEMKTTEKINGYHQNFNITYPDDWSLTVDNTDFSTDVTISKNGFKITLQQADVGSSRCIYTDEADYGVDLDYPNQKYPNYTQFSSKDATFRRSQWSQTDAYNLCNKNSNGNEFGLYTPFGFINYETPINHTKKQLEEMDSIIMSIKSV